MRGDGSGSFAYYAEACQEEASVFAYHVPLRGAFPQNLSESIEKNI